jgi:hypothetical protein
MSSSPATPTPTPKESVFQKFWAWIIAGVTHVENGIEDLFGSKAATAIETAGKELLSSNFGPLITTALADATDVVTGQMSVSKAIASLIALFEAEGKSLSTAAALQIIGVAQNALPVKGSTVIPIA